LCLFVRPKLGDAPTIEPLTVCVQICLVLGREIESGQIMLVRPKLGDAPTNHSLP
jgi:hypothetical protein